MPITSSGANNNPLLVIHSIFQVAAVFARNDKDGDGRLSRQEFKEMMRKDKK